MDRASDSGSEGWGFESLPAYQIKERIPIRGSSLLFRPPGGKGLVQQAVKIAFFTPYKYNPCLLSQRGVYLFQYLLKRKRMIL